MKSMICALIAGLVMATATPPSSSANTFRFAHAGDAESMDPFSLVGSESIYLVSNIYEALTRFSPTGEIEPALAISWEAIEPTVWRFRLREGVTFHNGNPFTADDVLFSFKRAQSPSATMGYAIRSIREVRKVDKYTVDIMLHAPNSVIARELTFWFMMDEDWAREHGAEEPANVRTGEANYATSHANGTGPFLLESRKPDVQTVFEVNPEWWDKRQHNLDKIVFTPIASNATRVAALLSGEVDLIAPLPLRDRQRVASAPGFKVMETTALRTLFLGMDQESEELPESNIRGSNPLKDLRVRQAIYHAIDIEPITDVIMQGAATSTALLITPMIFGYDKALDERLPYDPETSRRLLAEAGYPDGFEIGLTCPNDEYPNDEQLCQALVPMLSRIGINVDLSAMTRSRYYEKVLSGEAGMYLFGWAGTQTMDGSSILANVIHTPEDGSLGTYNAGGYSNERVDQVLSEVLRETESEERRALFSEAFRMIRDEVAYVPLYSLHVVWGARENIDIPQGADNRIRLWHVNMQ